MGCGPAVELDEDTDGGSESESDTIIDPSSPTDPTSGDCEVEGCPEGFYCGPEGQCIEEYDCYDYGCYCVYGHCSPGYDCYDDDDCGPGELCGGYDGCEVVQNLSDCGSPVALEGTLLAIPTGNPIGALAFVDLDPATPGEDLVVGTDIDGWLIPSSGEAVPLPSAGAVTGAAATDLDGDGATDLVLIDAGRLAVHYGFGTEAMETVQLSTEQPVTEVHALRGVEGLPSLAILDAGGTTYTVTGSPDRSLALASIPLPFDAISKIAPFAIGDGSDGYVWDSGFDVGLYTVQDGQLSLGQPYDGPRTFGIGRLTGSPRSDILWATPYSDWTLLDISIGGASIASRAIYFDYDTYAVGDLDGNGIDDALAVGFGGLAVMPGDPDWGLTCFSQAPFDGGASRLLALGDLDGDGMDEAVIVTDAGGAPTSYDIGWSP